MQIVEPNTTSHVSANNQACAIAEKDEQATVDLFECGQALFSNGCINLKEVVERAKLSEKQLTTDLLCEMAIAKRNDIAKHRALHKTLIKTLSDVALDMNLEMAISH